MAAQTPIVLVLSRLVALSSLAAADSPSCDAQLGSTGCKAPRSAESILLQAKFASRTGVTAEVVEEEEEEARGYTKLADSGWCTTGLLFDLRDDTYTLEQCSEACDLTETCQSIGLHMAGTRCLGFSSDCSSRWDNANIVPYLAGEAPPTEKLTKARSYTKLADSGWCATGLLFDLRDDTYTLEECQGTCDLTETCQSIGLHVAGKRCLGFSSDCSSRLDNANIVPYLAGAATDFEETPTAKPTAAPTEAPTPMGIPADKLAEVVVVDGSRFLENVAYGSDAKHFVDFFWPDEVDPQDGWPAVVAIHGSGGDKKELHGFCKQVIRRSEFTRACMPINYREKRVEHAQKQEDARNAAWWLVSNAASLKIRKESIILYGYSLGGFLANSIIWNEPDFTSKYVSAAIFSAGVGKNIVPSAVAKFKLGKKPPLLVISSKDDTVVPYEYSKAYCDNLSALGGDVHLLTYYTSGHSPSREPSFYEQIITFLNSPSTYEAPDTIHMTTTPIPGKCKNSCYTHPATWPKKCTWSKCSACTECEHTTTATTTQAPKCSWWCPKGAQPWSSKCHWSTGVCSTCKQCFQ